MIVVWARHLLLQCEPRLKGNGDLMDTGQKRRGHFVGHCDNGRTFYLSLILLAEPLTDA